jgi:predicted NUDIX family NTP pyrophosphohydrolase
MPERSAGLLVFRRIEGTIQILLVHPGGPFWAKKDEGAWSIPKGIIEPGEDDLAAAIRETREELGTAVNGAFLPLGSFRQPSGKTIVAWAVEANPPLDVNNIQSSTFTMEWPPKSGRSEVFPEVDRAGWFDPDAAALKILKGQRPMLDELAAHLR